MHHRPPVQRSTAQKSQSPRAPCWPAPRSPNRKTQITLFRLHDPRPCCARGPPCHPHTSRPKTSLPGRDGLGAREQPGAEVLSRWTGGWRTA
ncbi:hypothetical protein BDU57DRAFT_518374 [Ampelomyces quisqualis]|uniref:Uncharacterized protein n=1 Tax=Ampelomyces quisqualis TaxID=50730 RepID=A0A6A5QIX9_AMPQU|nr:hypothetical protein BDU57DRAFT_518374 [Ampelomyces quisqualis]